MHPATMVLHRAGCSSAESCGGRGWGGGRQGGGSRHFVRSAVAVRYVAAESRVIERRLAAWVHLIRERSVARDGRILTRRLQSACKGRHTSCSVIRLDEVKRETRLVEWNLEVADVSNWAPMFLRCIHTHHAKLPGLCLRNPGHPSCF